MITRRSMREGWHRVKIGHVYDFEGTPARVTHRQPTTEGTYVTLRDPETGASLGQAHHSRVGNEIGPQAPQDRPG